MQLLKSSVQVSRGLTYSYFHVKPSQPSKSYILFLHGFPSLPTDFHRQISYLSAHGYGIVAPYLLGYGDTSRPEESDLYRLKLMSGDIVDILKHHSIPHVLAVGHDWGATLLTRLEFYYPEYITRMALLTIGGAPFGQAFDVDAVNSMMKEQLGYEGFGYMVFFVRNSDAADVLNAHQGSMRSLIFAEDANLWKKHFGAIGGLQQWAEEGRQTATIAGFTDQVRQEHETEFASDKDGYKASLNWYKNHVSNKNIPDESDKLEEYGLTAYHTSKPVLGILAAQDVIAIAAVHRQMIEAYAPSARCVIADTSHWVMMQAADEVSEELELFFAQ